MYRLVKQLIENNEIVIKIKEIMQLEDNISHIINNNPELKLTVLEYRKNLNNFFLKQLQKLLIPKILRDSLLFQFNQRLDLIFAPSIIDHGIKDFKDYRFAVNIIIENLNIDRQMKLSTLFFLKSFNNVIINEVLEHNQAILSSNPLTERQIIALNKKVIFSMFDGLENINNFELVKYSSKNQDILYDGNNNPEINITALKINVKNQDKINKLKDLKQNWDDQLDYYDSLKNGLLTYQLDSNIVLDANYRYDRFKKQIIKNEILKNNYLLDINYSEVKENFLKIVIDECEQAIKLNLQDQCLKYLVNNIWQKSINPLIEQFKALTLQLAEACFKFYNLKHSLRSVITNITDNLSDEYEINDLIYNELFDILCFYVLNEKE